MGFSHKRVLQFYGIMWGAIGCFLLFYKGLHVVETLEKGVLSLENRPMIFFRYFVSFLGSFKYAVVLWTFLCLIMGWIAYRWGISKIVQRKILFLMKKQNPLPWNALLSVRELAFIFIVLYSGEITKLLYKEFRFLVFVALGFAFLLGSIRFFRVIHKQPEKSGV